MILITGNIHYRLDKNKYVHNLYFKLRDKDKEYQSKVVLLKCFLDLE